MGAGLFSSHFTIMKCSTRESFAISYDPYTRGIVLRSSLRYMVGVVKMLYTDSKRIHETDA